ncbi:hypothetical protein L211DRAFT_834537 [Terfezia boudieri ATCC MYA-4762]|uniref:Uncharacterized protein n=1 Tax=Terfezia boudieri ATCC MYA-4762 TaxID=1051890 RepID=A0A3N4LXR8_9PEZI|nr:hypothetical protein L211DRAFT_834537 [Terfezia boudieri ATCC MYA-4762]
MRCPRPPPPPSSSKETAILNLNLKLNPTHKHKHKHSLSTHPVHISSSTITEKDGKRYEGVWAANRGYLMHILRAGAGVEVEMLSEGVHPLVVRELWGRSRLGREMLEEV